MRTTILIAIFAIAISVLNAGNPGSETKSLPSFDKLKLLVGTWKGKTEDGKDVTVSYKVVSAGTSIMETLDMAENKEAMVTMYHADGNKLMMTHYCSMGNQPRMRTAGLSKDGNTLAFSFVDISNTSSKDDSYMKKLVFTFKDDDHFSQEWTMHMKGNQSHPSTFQFERAK